MFNDSSQDQPVLDSSLETALVNSDNKFQNILRDPSALRFISQNNFSEEFPSIPVTQADCNDQISDSYFEYPDFSCTQVEGAEPKEPIANMMVTQSQPMFDSEVSDTREMSERGLSSKLADGPCLDIFVSQSQSDVDVHDTTILGDNNEGTSLECTTDQLEEYPEEIVSNEFSLENHRNNMNTICVDDAILEIDVSQSQPTNFPLSRSSQSITPDNGVNSLSKFQSEAQCESQHKSQSESPSKLQSEYQYKSQCESQSEFYSGAFCEHSSLTIDTILDSDSALVSQAELPNHYQSLSNRNGDLRSQSRLESVKSAEDSHISPQYSLSLVEECNEQEEDHRDGEDNVSLDILVSQDLVENEEIEPQITSCNILEEQDQDFKANVVENFDVISLEKHALEVCDSKDHEEVYNISSLCYDDESILCQQLQSWPKCLIISLVIPEIFKKLSQKEVSHKIDRQINESPCTESAILHSIDSNLSQNTSNVVSTLIELSNNNKSSPVRKYHSPIGVRGITTAWDSEEEVDFTKPRKKFRRKHANTSDKGVERDKSIEPNISKGEHSSTLNGTSGDNDTETSKLLLNRSTERSVEISSESNSRKVLPMIQEEGRNINFENEREEEWVSQPIHLMNEPEVNHVAKEQKHGGCTDDVKEDDLETCCFPEDLTLSDCSQFPHLWSRLKAFGWNWSRGKGLVTYFYNKPGKTSKSSEYQHLKDYFISEEEVLEYARNSLLKKSKRSSSSIALDSVPSIIEEKLELLVPSTPLECNEEVDFDRIPWSELWKCLHSDGWTWDYGTGLVQMWYFLPGFNMNNSVVGVSRFGSQESVRSFLKSNSLGKDEPDESLASSQFESQSWLWNPQSLLKLKDWNLSRNRKKRVFSSSVNVLEENRDSDDDSIDRSGNEGNKKDSKTESTKSTRKKVKLNISDKDKNVKSSTKVDRHPSSPLKESSNRSGDYLPLGEELRMEALSNEKIVRDIGDEDSTQLCIDTPIVPIKSDIRSPSRINPMLWDNYEFIMTGLSEKEKTSISSLITKNGGTLLGDWKSANSSRHQVLISQTNGFRRPNFLLAIAHGVPIVHLSWIIDSVQRKQILPFNKYFLPLGVSALHPLFIFPKLSWYDGRTSNVNSNQVLAGIRVVNLAGNVWMDIIEACGGIIVGLNESIKDILLNGLLKPGKFVPFDIIVIDSSHYCEGFPKSSSMNSVSKTGVKSPGVDLSNTVVESLSAWNKSSQRAYTKFHVVTIDWVVHCIMMRRQLDVEDSDIFSLPSDPIHRPPMYKHESKLGGERYVKFDTVFYGTSDHETGINVGKIVSFSRRNIDATVQVRIRPLSITENSNGVCPKGSNEEVIVEASFLRGKATLVSREVYENLSYKNEDKKIYCASSLWEEELVDCEEERSLEEMNIPRRLNDKNIVEPQEYFEVSQEI